RRANSYYEHSMILNESNEYLRIDSRTKGIKLSELERKVSRIVVFLDTENKIIGTISNIQLGMFFCHNRYACYGFIPVNCQAFDNIMNLHALTACPELSKKAFEAVSTIFKNYRDICSE